MPLRQRKEEIQMRVVGLSKSWFVGAAALLALTVPAFAGTDGYMFALTAQNAAGAGHFYVTEDMGQWQGDVWRWQLTEPVAIIGGTGREVIATLNEGEVLFRSDPVISLGFAVQAGDAQTTFTIQSALLSFPALTNPTGQASAGITLTDFDGSGAQLNGLGPLGGAYLAQYNGFVPGGTTFHEAISQMLAGPFDIVDDNTNSGAVNILGSVSSMSSQFSFTLSANDLAAGTSIFEIVPEPASILLIVAAALLRRR